MLIELGLLSLTNIIAIAIISIIVMAKTIAARLRLTVSLTIASLLLWQDTVYISNNVTENVLFWSNVLFLWPTLAFISFYIFVFFLINAHIKTTNRYIKFATLLSVSLLGVGTLLQLATWSRMQIFVSGNSADTLVRGVDYSTYISGLIVALFAVLLFVLIAVILSRRNDQQRQAVLTVLQTVIIASIYGVLTSAIIPVVTSSQTYASLGLLTIDIFAIGFTISVFRYKLFDIRSYVIRTVVYILSILLLVLIYSTVVSLISRVALGYDFTMLQTSINLFFIVIFSFLFQPIKLFFDRVTKKLFYNDAYDIDDFFSHLNREISSTNDLSELLERVSQFIATTLHSEQVFFALNAGSEYLVKGTYAHVRFKKDQYAIVEKYFRKQKYERVAKIDALASTSSLKEMMNRLKIAIAIPLKVGNTTIGHLYIGDQRKNRYSVKDINVLITVADELVIAVQNAQAVQEIKELNSTLQQRIEDATRELRASNMQLQRLDEAKDEFISMASHQLRTPLTSVKGYISMVLEGDAGKINATQRQLLEESFTSSERMVHLINDFLNVSRLQTGKFMLERKHINLAKVVAQEVESLKTTAKAHELKIRFRMPSYFPALYIDEGKIRQVLMNFIDNAIYYSREGTVITVSLAVVDGSALLEVHDTGIGVPKAEQQHLFGKFFRATNARRQRPDGTGVGLFLAKKVITAHGGTMVFESVEGEGSTFGFRLPIKKLSELPSKQPD